MISSIISRLVILLFGTLYPAYASYKTVKSRNNKEYVKWMMYWIVFALFTCAETFTDIFFSWFPFYYEIKIIIVIWLLSPATKGSSILYRKFVHPTLSSKEQEIDEYIAKAKEQSYRQVFDLGSKSMRVLMQTALKSGGGIVNHLRRSYSLSDLSDQIDETDVGEVSITEAHLTRRRRSPHRSSSSSSSQMYFSEIDIRKDSVAHIQSVEDISSGYSSGEPLYPKARGSLVRSGSVGPGRTRVTRVTRSTGIAKKTASNDEYDADDSKAYEPNLTPSNIKTEEADHSIVTKNEKRRSSSSEEDFVDSLDALHEYSLLAKNSSNILRKDNFLSACPVSKSHSFSGVTEREILKNKLKELYDIYSSITNEGQHLSKVQEKPNKSSSDIENMKSVDSDKEHRAGRYNKKMAPSPPNISIDKLGKSPNSSPSPAIKATLTLKPGVIKTLGPSPEESRPQFFSADSPTLRRKNKSKSPISRLMMLPKKMAFWNKDDAVLEDKQTKRFSWNDVFSNGQRLKPISKMQSRSYEELQNKYLSVCDVPLSNSNEPTACFRARKLSASPTMCRKLETIKLEQQDL